MTPFWSPAATGILLTILATGFEGFAQVCLKQATRTQPAKHAWRMLGLALFACEALLYTWALRYLEVSTAFPLGALSFVFVTLLSQGLLRERVDRARWVGVLLILAGSTLVALRA